jgi:hypothetical protein
MKQCSYPCPIIAADRENMQALRAHLLNEYQCLDAWIALSKLVQDPQQRRDCLERAAVLAPTDAAIQQAYLEAALAVNPNDQMAQRRLAELRTLQLLSDVKTTHFHEQPRARLLGDILLSIGAISPEELREVLRAQRNSSIIAADRRLGQLLLKQGVITPSKLARALIIQQQERSSLRMAPQVLGEYLVDKGYISPQQLELALAEQLRLDQKGHHLSLGQVLVRLNMITVPQIEQAAKEQAAFFWSKFGY